MINMNSCLHSIMALRFAMWDLHLYLDTHPQCPCGLEYFRCMRNERDDALCSYEMNFGPITMDNSQAECSWEWINDPWPWEMEA